MVLMGSVCTWQVVGSRSRQSRVLLLVLGRFLMDVWVLRWGVWTLFARFLRFPQLLRYSMCFVDSYGVLTLSMGSEFDNGF